MQTLDNLQTFQSFLPYVLGLSFINFTIAFIGQLNLQKNLLKISLWSTRLLFILIFAVIAIQWIRIGFFPFSWSFPSLFFAFFVLIWILFFHILKNLKKNISLYFIFFSIPFLFLCISFGLRNYLIEENLLLQRKILFQLGLIFSFLGSFSVLSHTFVTLFQGVFFKKIESDYLKNFLLFILFLASFLNWNQINDKFWFAQISFLSIIGFLNIFNRFKNSKWKLKIEFLLAGLSFVISLYLFMIDNTGVKVFTLFLNFFYFSFFVALNTNIDEIQKIPFDLYRETEAYFSKIFDWGSLIMILSYLTIGYCVWLRHGEVQVDFPLALVLSSNLISTLIYWILKKNEKSQTCQTLLLQIVNCSMMILFLFELWMPFSLQQ